MPDELAENERTLVEADDVERRTLSQIREVLEQARKNVGRAVNFEMVSAYWEVGRQMRITDGQDDYYVDLVFCNYLMRCFVLIDLKTRKLTH